MEAGSIASELRSTSGQLAHQPAPVARGSDLPVPRGSEWPLLAPFVGITLLECGAVGFGLYKLFEVVF